MHIDNAKTCIHMYVSVYICIYDYVYVTCYMYIACLRVFDVLSPIVRQVLPGCSCNLLGILCGVPFAGSVLSFVSYLYELLAS